MLRSIQALKDYTIEARDGQIGRVDDTLFDDLHWTVRYLVIDTGGWLTGRSVLVSPVAVTSVGSQRQAIDVDLTKQQVEGSPGISTDPPVAHQMELEYANYYQYQPYWAGPNVWGAGLYPRAGLLREPVVPYMAQTPSEAGAQPTPPAERGDRHLRSAREVTGYAIEATDGSLGHVDDFLMDDETWTLRYMVVDTGSWWHGKTVLVAPNWVREIDWTGSRVVVDLGRDTIKEAPPFDPSRPVGRPYEERLYAYYGRAPYWADEEQRA